MFHNEIRNRIKPNYLKYICFQNVISISYWIIFIAHPWTMLVTYETHFCLGSSRINLPVVPDLAAHSGHLLNLHMLAFGYSKYFVIFGLVRTLLSLILLPLLLFPSWYGFLLKSNLLIGFFIVVVFHYVPSLSFIQLHFFIAKSFAWLFDFL